MAVGHITLNSQQYMLQEPISNGYQRQTYTPFAAQLGTGKEYADLQEWSAWVMDNWIAGAGIKDAEGGGFKYAELDSRFSEQIILNAFPQVSHLATREALTSSSILTAVTVDGTTIESFGNQYSDTNSGNIDVFWLYAEPVPGATVTVTIYNDSNNEPNASQGAKTITISETIRGGRWMRFAFDSTITLGFTWWAVVTSSDTIVVPVVDTTGTAKTYDGSSWNIVDSNNYDNWSKVKTLTGVDEGEGVACNSNTNVWCALASDSPDSAIYRSTDEGDTWSLADSLTGRSIAGTGSIAAGSSNVWCCAARDGAVTARIWRSTDDGANWTEVHDTGHTISYQMDTDGAGVWCLATTSGIVRSSDNGATWATVYSGGECRGLAYDGSSVWVAGYNALLVKSTDNGATWSAISGHGLTGIDEHIASDKSGVLLLDVGGDIQRSADDGATWTEVYGDASNDFLAYAYDSGQDRWVAVGKDAGGLLTLYSNDDGVTWTADFDSATAGDIPTDIAFNNGVWVAVGYDTSVVGAIWRSTGAGEALAFADGNGVTAGTNDWIIRSFNSEMYLINDNDMWKWDGTTDNRWEAVTTSGGTKSSGATDAIVWNDELWVACGDNDLYRMNSAESVTVATGDTADLFMRHAGYLWRAHENDVWYTADGTTWSASIEVGPDDDEIRGMAALGGVDVYAATDDGLYLIAAGDFVQGVTPWGVPSTSNGVGMLHYQGDLYIPVGRDILRYTQDGQILNMGINNIDGLPTDRQGKAIRLLGLNNWLIACLEPSVGLATGKPTVWAWDRDGWHHLLSLPVGTTIADAAFERDSNNLWVVARNDSYAFPVKMVLPNDVNNPAKDNLSTLYFQPYGWLETDWFHGGLREIQKDFESVFIAGEDISSTQWVKVYWQDDDSTAWEYLGQVTSNQQTLTWSTAGTRPNSKRLKIGVLLYTGTSNSTPIVNAVRVKFHPMLTDLFNWNLSIRVADNIETLDGTLDTRTSAQIQDDLETVMASVPPLTFVDVDGTSYTVKAERDSLTPIRMEYNSGAQDYEAIYRITLRQVR